ncbi:hypothetical protein PMG11_05488 [Penicillium brasilianum]|uniref:JmjC domain-containing protein n=1 Tax=Penicillium brasilianum TaxID=104259 RepID=A0A0F7VJI5_PENBI|nr:hypothetical protein PMG11_05488 [Penicillium brasilianum]
MIQRSRAVFEPFPPHLNIEEVVQTTPSFEFAKRISCDSVSQFPREVLELYVLTHVVKLGLPLVITGFDKHLDKDLFSEKWLQQHYASQTYDARDLGKGANLRLTLGHYLKNMATLTEPINASTYARQSIQRLYLKDIDCPQEWHRALKQLIPSSFFYLNQSPMNGPKSPASQFPEPPKTPQGEAVARSGDLMSSLPVTMRAENLMCYIGHEGTYTPAHQEMCASLGQNLMVEASDESYENGNGKPTRPGSSIWFMTGTQDRRVVSEYWMSTLGHNLDLENHFAQLNAWKCAPFTTYVVEQRPGDLILVPPLAAHQVWNRGTRTMKVAWNRTTVETLEMAFDEALANARMICRDEQYKNKAIVYYTLERYSGLLRKAPDSTHPEVRMLQEDFQRLFNMYTDILLSESFSKSSPAAKEIEYEKFESNITCSYCRCNIFNRFLTCPWCVGEGNDTYDICMDCYVLGRSCRCISKLKWVEQFPWKQLTSRHETWRQQIIAFKYDGPKPKNPPTLLVARSELGRKSLAEICQEQMRLRPWVDPTKPKEVKGVTPSDDDESDTDSRARKKRKSNGSKAPNGKGRCHMCKNSECLWKLAACEKCSLYYCYGSLFRAFDMLPQDAMQRPHWLCPKCRKVCNCSSCRLDDSMKPHQPFNILLGHDTRKIADPRSVESLVNMRLSNLALLKTFGDDNAERLERLRCDEEKRRQQQLAENDIHVGLDPPQTESPIGPPSVMYENQLPGIPIDPALELDGSYMSLG